MSIKVILFDLDGTLLPMDQNTFAKAYFGGLAKKAAPYGYEQEKLVKTIWGGTAAMIKNISAESNEAVFWKYFAGVYGEESKKDIAIFDDFYANEFEQVKEVCGFNPQAKECVEKIKDIGYRVALATNPIFPAVATKARIRWAGLTTNDFEYYTTYENSNRCKPNLDYYRNILNELNAPADECLMVGNDVVEDMVAEQLGMRVFLITDCLINKQNKDISVYPNGDFTALLDYVKGLNNETN